MGKGKHKRPERLPGLPAQQLRGDESSQAVPRPDSQNGTHSQAPGDSGSEVTATTEPIHREAGGMDTRAPTKLVPQSNAGECQNCKSLRLQKRLPNRTQIYAKRGSVRYCKCHVCGSTWKVAPRKMNGEP